MNFFKTKTLIIKIFIIIACISQNAHTSEHQTSFNDEVKFFTIPQELKTKKTWNFIVYMAANNNLHSYALKNLNQMMQVGSNSAVNIIVQIDGLQQRKIKRYYVHKNNLIVLAEESSTGVLPSGTPESLFNLVDWTIKNFPADYNAVVLWNHGSGIKDPTMWGKTLMHSRDELFVFNDDSGKLELSRTLCAEFSLSEEELKKRGIAFNDAHRTYINNKELREVMQKIQTVSLGGKKLDAVFFDACHMGMAEIGYKLSSSVSFMAGSAEVEPGSGYNYASILQGCYNGITPKDLTRHVVAMYGQEYNSLYGELTQIGLNLEMLQKTKTIWANFSTALNMCIRDVINPDKTKSFANMLKALRTNQTSTTEFADNDYIDIQHFLTSLLQVCNNLTSSDNPLATTHKQKIKVLKQAIQELQAALFNQIIIQSSCGASLSKACGLAIYFPKFYVHSSYPKTTFDKEANWSGFLQSYIERSRSQYATNLIEKTATR